jgi:hypothetical protein
MLFAFLACELWVFRMPIDVERWHGVCRIDVVLREQVERTDDRGAERVLERSAICRLASILPEDKNVAAVDFFMNEAVPMNLAKSKS